MSEATLRQYFGPSPRHDRGCVEISFALDDALRHLPTLEPSLLKLGFKLRGHFPEESVPLDRAVREIAALLLARHATWWSTHGSEDGRGWAAIQFPFPLIAGAALKAAFQLAASPGPINQPLEMTLRQLSAWLAEISKIRMFMLAAAQLGGREAVDVSLTTEVYQIGQASKGVHFFRAGSERDSLTGFRIENNKHATVEMLGKLGLPTTTGMVAASIQEAAQAAAKLGLPCVVKPLSMNRGAGVAAGLATEAEVAAAAEAALKLSGQPVRIEKHVEGTTHRLLVAGDELLWAYRKTPAAVTGDGIATIAELIHRESARRLKIRDHSEGYLAPIIQDETMQRHLQFHLGLGLEAVLPAGKRVELAAQANTAAGGTLEDVTESVHPDNRALAIRVARMFRMGVIGIDYITPDLSRSWKDVSSAIIEVNRIPSLHALGDASVLQRTLMPNRLSGQVPALAAIGDADFRRRAHELLAKAFASVGFRLAVAEYVGADIPGLLLSPLPPEIEAMMLDPEADTMVVLCEPERIERAGLPLRRCDVLLVQEKSFVPSYVAAGTVVHGKPSQAGVGRVVRELARRYGAADEGGPLPALEDASADGPDNELRLKVWRIRAMPRAWFWEQTGLAAPKRPGLTTADDLLAAVRALAAITLGKDDTLAESFSYDDHSANWARPSLLAAIPLPRRQPQAARAALLAAVERVNEIAAMKIV